MKDLSLCWSVAIGCLSGLAVACSGSDSTPSGGSTGEPTTLASCDIRKETSKAPITTACGEVTSPLGTTVKLGPAGAVMDLNVGKGFENTLNANDQPGNTYCEKFAQGFNEDPALTAQLLDTGNIDFSLYTVYRPANWPAEKIPVLSWGNGTCAQPEGYGTLLRYIASHGYFVVAANSRFVGSGAEIKHALDFAQAANDDPASPYHGHLDTSKMGVMGHSQGSLGAGLAAGDSRVSNVILFNGGLTASKPSLAVSGDLDVFNYTSAQMSAAVQAAPEAAFLYYHNPVGMGPLKGHLVLMMSPERVVEPAGGWWDLVFKSDPDAKALFEGTTCGLCNQTDQFDFGEKGLN